ncbi:PEP-CTERM sorting domain-containing protein [Rariglobus hedericola]|uniref:PEP-CTERM sorting domain-containing protein n=1 Tax=Rariglobus hedericola TaxID=2597822 RepID=A0A556QPJ0_9BACT|nr:PEP-CTERM sorting domain-containing protein [Rariglobus hedericola]TSJ78563.1 PEP-CTERM sorting domain-containing protein [Rariglobus hedericola]
MKILLPICAGLLFGASALHADSVPLDFETANQFTNSFRVLSAGGATLTQTSNGGANDYMQSANGSGSSYVYDANGASAGISSFTVSQSTSLTISADVSFTVSNNSFGIYIINAADESQGYLAIFNVNFSSTSDQIRFSNNAVPTTAGAGSPLNNGSFANNADTGIGLLGAFNNISLTYSINGSNAPVLTMTAGSQTSSITLSGTAFTDVEVGFRMSSTASGIVGMDNLNIATSAVPEPSTYAALAGIAVLGLATLRRRGNR